MATLQFAGEYEILESKLTTSTGVTINISKLIAEINLFEDLFSNALYGSIFIIDTNNVISRGPIIGQERVHLKIAIPTVTSSEAAIDVIFNVYKVGTNTEVNKGGQLIELSMVTPEFLKNNRVRVSKSYSNSIDNIVQDILQLDETLIGTTKNVQIDAAPPAPTGEKATCSRCKSRLEVRKGPTGWFLGCTRYPMCKGTKQL